MKRCFLHLENYSRTRGCYQGFSWQLHDENGQCHFIAILNVGLRTFSAPCPWLYLNKLMGLTKVFTQFSLHDPRLFSSRARGLTSSTKAQPLTADCLGNRLPESITIARESPTFAALLLLAQAAQKKRDCKTSCCSKSSKHGCSMLQ